MAQINENQKIQLAVVAKTNSGNVVSVDGPPFWSISDVNIASLEVAPDGLSAWVIANGIGSATVTVVADADLSAGVREISTSVDIQVTVGEADVLEITVGTPVNK